MTYCFVVVVAVDMFDSRLLIRLLSAPQSNENRVEVDLLVEVVDLRLITGSVEYMV